MNFLGTMSSAENLDLEAEVSTSAFISTSAYFTNESYNYNNTFDQGQNPDSYNQSMEGGPDRPVNPMSLAGIIATSIILGVMTLTTIVGNVFVIAAILLERNLQSVANYLILSLAVADLLVAVLVMPLGAVYEISMEWTFGHNLCDMWTSSDVLCCTASILHLLAIAVDRYWAVTHVHYIHSRTFRTIGTMILLIWLTSVVVSLAPLFGWKDLDFETRVNVKKECMVSQDVGYQIFATMATFYVPLVLILLLYWRIFVTARNRLRNRLAQKAALPSSGKMKISAKNDAVLKSGPIQAVKSATAAQINKLNQVQTVVVAMPLSSSSEKEDDVISGDQEEETAFVAKTFATTRQSRIKMSKSLQVSSNGHEEMRTPLCNGNGKSGSNCLDDPEVGPEEDSGTPSGSITPNNDVHTPSINETPLSLRRLSISKQSDLSAAKIEATIAAAATAVTSTAEKEIVNPRFTDQGCQTEIREKRKKRRPRNSLRHKPLLSKTAERQTSAGDGTAPTNQSELDRFNSEKLSKKKHVSLEAKRERKAAKTLAIVTGAFIACWLPFFILAIVMAIFKEHEFNHTLVSFFLWLGYFNSTLNPIIYTIFSPEFRNAFQRMLCGKPNTNHRPRHLQ